MDASGPRPPTPVPPRIARWLEAQLPEWEADGLLTPGHRADLQARYVPARRVGLVALVVGLGTAFLAVGLLWFVAANYATFSPALRFGTVTAVWLALVLVAEVLAGRRHRGAREVARPSSVPALIAVCRTLAAAAFGAVVLQAAQSLQVPAYEPRLLGCWALGALVHAYATGSLGALTIGLLTSGAWVVWFLTSLTISLTGGIAVVLAAGVIATSLAAVAHLPEFQRTPHDVGVATPWRLLGATFSLGGLFVAALPFGEDGTTGVPTGAVVLWIGAAVVAALALGLWSTLGRGIAGRSERLAEIGVATLAVLAGTGLASWQVGSAFAETADPAAWLRAGVCVVVFVAFAAFTAADGVLTDSPALTALATAALVVFVAAQSFAVFAPLMSGSVLFLVIGAVMLVTGLLAERLRRLLRRFVPTRAHLAHTRPEAAS